MILTLITKILQCIPLAGDADFVLTHNLKNFSEHTTWHNMQHKFHSMEERQITTADNDNHDRQLTAIAIRDDATHVLDRSSESAQPDATNPARRSPASLAAEVTTGDDAPDGALRHVLFFIVFRLS